ncbi:SAICAR synthase-like protein [Nemania sp. FL0916]|nr:SAICAR synthase-like protein [Nemania sp. FL0916]
MTRRQVVIARSIVYAILTSLPNGKPARKLNFLSRAFRLFCIFSLTFRMLRPDLFQALRGIWEIQEEDYRASFGAADSHNDVRNNKNKNKKDKDKKKKTRKRDDVLQPMGDMGYSGSTFFCTSDGAYLVKSVPRRFEHDFFKHELLLPYAEYMQANRSSLLVRITDLLERAHQSLGVWLGLAPSHHIVMENVLYGQDHASNHEEGEGQDKKWESWDLKPTSFFYPERDLAGGALATEATKSKLADEFDGKLRLRKDHAAQFRAQLEKDTRLLADNNAVDYSLFLVRISSSTARDPENQPPPLEADEGGEADVPIPPAQPPFAPPGPPSWRTGVTSSDGKEVYRAAILDFFWAKHTLHAKVMTGLVQGYNLIDERGPMSITAESDEYRERFLKMCGEFIEEEEDGEGEEE